MFACVVCMCVWYQRFISQGREANSELQSSVQAVFGLESMVMAAACDTTVSDAMALMASQNSSALLVKGVGAVKGIFTERDLCVHCANVWRLCADMCVCARVHVGVAVCRGSSRRAWILA